MILIILFLRMASLLVLRPLQPGGGWTGGCHIPLTGVTLTSGLWGLVSFEAGDMLELEEGVDIGAGPLPGAARGLRVASDWSDHIKLGC